MCAFAYNVPKKAREGTDVDKYNNSFSGLNDTEVEISRRDFGANVMTKKKREGFIKKLIKNLSDPVIKILLFALTVNLIFMFKSANYIECIGIGVSVILATFISTLSECGSERAFEHLEGADSKSKVTVIRNGHKMGIDIANIVVGDIVSISAGEGICADGELVWGQLSLDTSSMTGESREFAKRAKRDNDSEDDTPNSAYYLHRGCTVLSGDGIMRVKRVGDETFLGKISNEIQIDTRESPLKLRLARLAKQISRLGYIAAICISLIYLFNIFVIDSHFDMGIIRYKLTNFGFVTSNLFSALTLALTVIVVAVPEGLPMMIAVVLSSNVKKMIKDNVLVKKSSGIESAGSMNILFCDKTGTLTQGNMSVSSIYSGDMTKYKDIYDLESRGGSIFEAYYLGANINTRASLGTDTDGKKVVLGGNGVERALILSVAHKRGRINSKNTNKLGFDSKLKMSAATAEVNSKRRLMIKGAPDMLLPYVFSYMTPDGKSESADKQKIANTCQALTSNGKRVILIAESDRGNVRDIEYGRIPPLTLVCLVTLEDRIRKEAARSVDILKAAGIQTVMITGDNADTAKSIARACNILDERHNAVLTSSQMARMSDMELKNILPRLCVVARALPSDKSRLVRVAGELDLVVGMTGDGVNDAPALKAADVGFAMGSGTQVAKDAGDIVILDDNLSSIVRAVHYGRNIFKSIRKFVNLQLLMNFCAVGVSVICPFLGVDSPVTVVQMLWINIIMDTLGGLAFAGEAPLDSDMREKPKRRAEPILNGYMINQIIFQGGFTIALCIAFLKSPKITSIFRYSPNNSYLLSAFFALFIFSSVFNCFGCRTDRLKLFSGISKNKGFVLIMSAVMIIQVAFIYLGGQVLRTVPLTSRELFYTLLISTVTIPAELIRKLLWRKFFGHKGY